MPDLIDEKPKKRYGRWREWDGKIKGLPPFKHYPLQIKFEGGKESGYVREITHYRRQL